MAKSWRETKRHGISYPQGIGEKRSPHIDASKERSAMAKGGESKTECAQISSEEVHIKDNNDHTSHMYKRMVRGKETIARKILDCCEEGNIVTANKASATMNDQELKMNAMKAVDLQPSPKGQRDVYSQSGFKDFRFTERVVQDHVVTMRVPRYVVSELEDGNQDFEWILGMVQRTYVQEQSNARL